jgi:hypothetical protein
MCSFSPHKKNIEIASDHHSSYNNSVIESPVREKRGGLSDAPQKIQDLQIALLRMASVAERISRAFMLSEAMISLSRQGLKRRHPELSPQELDLLFIEYCYGTSLSQRVRIQSERQHP